MAKFIVDKESVPQNEYQVYVDTTDNSIIAVNRDIEGVKKIERLNLEHPNQADIPDQEIVRGKFLRLNEKTGKYEMHSGMEHEFRIKNLLFANYQMFWE